LYILLIIETAKPFSNIMRSRPCCPEHIINKSELFFFWVLFNYVRDLNLKELGFKHAELEDTGRPPYNPADFYICPAGHEMSFRNRGKHQGKMMKLYKTDRCKHCKFK